MHKPGKNYPTKAKRRKLLHPTRPLKTTPFSHTSTGRVWENDASTLETEGDAERRRWN
jgi:hypothetical protein